MDYYLQMWRIRIGLFVKRGGKMKPQCTEPADGKAQFKTMQLIWPFHRAILLFALACALIIVSGDTEINPGPMPFPQKKQTSQTPVSHEVDHGTILCNSLCILQADFHQADEDSVLQTAMFFC